MLCSEIHKLIKSIWNNESCLISGRGLLLYQFTRRAIKADYSNCRGIPLLSSSYKIVFNILPSILTQCVDEIIGDYHYSFRRNRSTTDQISFSFIRHWRKNGSTMRQYISYS
jgi:hypothetical protein